MRENWVDAGMKRDTDGAYVPNCRILGTCARKIHYDKFVSLASRFGTNDLHQCIVRFMKVAGGLGVDE